MAARLNVEALRDEVDEVIVIVRSFMRGPDGAHRDAEDGADGSHRLALIIMRPDRSSTPSDAI